MRSDSSVPSGSGISEVAVRMAKASRDGWLESRLSVGEVVARLVASAGAFLEASSVPGEVEADFSGWLCDGDAPLGFVGLSGGISDAMASSIDALASVCVEDAVSGDELSELASLVALSGEASAGDLVTLGAAARVGLLGDVGELVSEVSGGASVPWGDVAALCGHLMSSGADVSWGSSLVRDVRLGRTSPSVAGCVVAAWSEGRLGTDMLSSYATDVASGAATWSNLGAVVRCRMDASRLGR